MRTVPLSDVCDISMGQAPKGTSYNINGNGYPLLAGAGDFGDLTPVSSKFTSQPTKISKPNDILLCIRATIGDLNWSDKEYCLGRGVAGLRPKNGSLDHNYLWRWLTFARRDLEKRARGSTFKQVSRKDIAELEITLPETLEEQRRIAAILDKADAIRLKREQALTLADGLLKSTFLEMFGDPVTNPMGWDEVPLGDIAEITSGLTKGRKVKPDQTLRSLPYMRVANVQDGFLDLNEIKEIEATETEIDRFRLYEGDLLLTEGGDPDKLGRGCVWREELPECIHQNHIFRVRVDQSVIVPDVLSRQIGSRRGKDYFLRAAKQTTGIATINKRQLSAYPVLLPDRAAQARYQAAREKADPLLSKLFDEIGQAERLFASLSQRAFRGDL
ncbi:restriction endonuclease subunit S [Roseospirillum parvum]|uniref:Type I restriction enzyme, S subunit n=1 Tax=Roseospirillum parvum TaxID=83401 RepID=A0A1G8F2X8_9PROT|nr:restriction endonuclease subunit S [Roseospirillum parvum]SDH76503.1 type I restriction enzyme, S subunit [Roseospirillum parvum]